MAITGHNGTGKSTFIKQLLKLNRLEGHVKLDGD